MAGSGIPVRDHKNCRVCHGFAGGAYEDVQTAWLRPDVYRRLIRRYGGRRQDNDHSAFDPDLCGSAAGKTGYGMFWEKDRYNARTFGCDDHAVDAPFLAVRYSGDRNAGTGCGYTLNHVRDIFSSRDGGTDSGPDTAVMPGKPGSADDPDVCGKNRSCDNGDGICREKPVVHAIAGTAGKTNYDRIAVTVQGDRQEKNMKKQFAVFGLGSFGKSVVLTLERFGCDVIAVDESYEKVQDISESAAYAMRADVTDPEAMAALGARNLDGVVIAISERFEASVMATIISKELGIPFVLAKAKDELHGKILEKVGADSVIYPERDMGSRVAKKLMSSEFTDWIDLSPDYSLTERVLPKQWAGKSLAQLRVREQYGINVVGVMDDGKMDVAFDPHTPLPAGCMLFLIGSNSALEAFEVGE